MIVWCVAALAATSLGIAAFERARLLRFLTRIYERGGAADLVAAAAATRHLAPPPGTRVAGLAEARPGEWTLRTGYDDDPCPCPDGAAGELPEGP